jgi:hypothetical protein
MLFYPHSAGKDLRGEVEHFGRNPMLKHQPVENETYQQIETTNSISGSRGTRESRPTAALMIFDCPDNKLDAPERTDVDDRIGQNRMRGAI